MTGLRIIRLTETGVVGERVQLIDRMTHQPAGSYVRRRHGWAWTEEYADGTLLRRKTDNDGGGLFTRQSFDGDWRQDVGTMQFRAPQSASAMRRRLHRMHE